MRIRMCAATLSAVLLVLLAAPAAATETGSQPLPQPLRLETALALIDADYPALRRARALRERAERELEAAQAASDIELQARLAGIWIEPNDLVPVEGSDDSRATITGRKLLTDFGHSRHRIAASQHQAEVSLAEEELAHAQHRLAVLQRYFDVLLADLSFARDTEAMASAFVTLNRARERNELGQVSDIDLFELEAVYQSARGTRLRALQEQHRTRAELAEILNRPHEAPAQVLGPALPLALPELPDIGSLLEAVDRQNPEIAIRRAQVEVAQRRVAAARSENKPRLSVEAQVGTWQREFGGDRNPASVGLILEIPLYQGRRQSAAVGQATADRHLAQADLDLAMKEVRSAVRELFFEIEALLVQRDEAIARMDYRELYLDRARALYDMEEAADLGDSMVRQSAAAHFNAGTEYALALAFERLALMVGEPSLSPFSPDS
jgi:outer membrane protein TolC